MNENIYNTTKKGTDWDLIIVPKNNLFDLRLQQVWKYRDLLLLFVRRDFVAFYKQTILGPLWYFIQPIFSALTYLFIFGQLAGLSTDGIPQILFYLTGIATWTYFSDCFLKSSNVFRDNAGLFGKVFFPRLIMPLSFVLSNLIRFGIQMLLLLIMIIYYSITSDSIHISWYIILFPIFVLLIALQGIGLGMLISAMTTKYRDLALMTTYGLSLLIYATPVVYPLSALSGKLKLIISLNPLSPIFEGIRKSLYGQGTFDIYSLLYVITISSIIFITGIVVYNRGEKNFIDTI